MRGRGLREALSCWERARLLHPLESLPPGLGSSHTVGPSVTQVSQDMFGMCRTTQNFLLREAVPIFSESQPFRNLFRNAFRIGFHPTGRTWVSTAQTGSVSSLRPAELGQLEDAGTSLLKGVQRDSWERRRARHCARHRRDAQAAARPQPGGTDGPVQETDDQTAAATFSERTGAVGTPGSFSGRVSDREHAGVTGHGCPWHLQATRRTRAVVPWDSAALMMLSTLSAEVPGELHDLGTLAQAPGGHEPQPGPREEQGTFRFLIVAKCIESEDYTFTTHLKGPGTDGFLRFPGSRGDTGTFTDGDVVGWWLVCAHEDSETWGAGLLLLAPPPDQASGGAQGARSLSTEIAVTVSVQLKNAERPASVAHEAFHVVRRGSARCPWRISVTTTLTPILTMGRCRTPSSGSWGERPKWGRGVSGDPTQKPYQFWQECLWEGRVPFRHDRGADSGPFVLFETDGIHCSSLLEARVSVPYGRAASNNGSRRRATNAGGSDPPAGFRQGDALADAARTSRRRESPSEAVRQPAIPEAGSVALLENYLKIPSKCFEGSDHEFVLHKPPKQGYIEISHFPRVKLVTFTSKQGNEWVCYVHDDSEGLLDNFTILANSSELGKPSLPRTLFVSVASGTEEAPVITANNPPPPGLTHAPALLRLPKPGRSVFGLCGQASERLKIHPRGGRENTGRTLDASFMFTPPPPPRRQPRPEELRATASHEARAGNKPRGPGQGEGGAASQHPRKVLVKCHRALESSPLPRAAVREGGQVLTDQPEADASSRSLKVPASRRSSCEVWVQATAPPPRGPIPVRGGRGRRKPSFSQHTGSKSGITYLRDDSESPADNFPCAVWPHPKGASAPKPELTFLPEETLNIAISPGSHQAPEGRTRGLRLKGLQGGRLVVGPEDLEVGGLPGASELRASLGRTLNTLRHIITKRSRHVLSKCTVSCWAVLRATLGRMWPRGRGLDAPDETVLGGGQLSAPLRPDHGFLSPARHPDTPVPHFSQADIGNAQVWVAQGGTPPPESFLPRDDGQHCPLYQPFPGVIPTAIPLVNPTDLPLPQGQATVPTTYAHLSAMSCGRSPRVTSKVTRPPQPGRLLVENQLVFTAQEDLGLGRLSCHTTNVTASRDWLQFSPLPSDSNLTGPLLWTRSVQPGPRLRWLACRLRGRRAEKAKPLIEPQADLEPVRPSARPGSLPASTVMATPICRAPAVPHSVFRAPPPGQAASAVAEPGDEAPGATWLTLDPAPIQLCPQPNPIPRPSQSCA
ncbi:LOW QUALITY PROTEIN: chondroitin sulfate proteoglycan 4-like [Glossophaga mutica]